jgi:TM2 domain-containing membrane protein YozV
MSDPDQTTYTLRWRGRELGPYSLAQINQKLDDHEIGLGHEIRHEDKWMTLEEFFAAMKSAAAAAAKPPPAATPAVSAPGAPPPFRPGSANPGAGAPVETPADAPPIRVVPKPTAMRRGAEPSPGPMLPPRHRLVYALLGILFGFLGAHNYYARHWLTGVLQLLLSIATYLLGFGIIAPWLWALAEAVLVRRDGNGNEMI